MTILHCGAMAGADCLSSCLAFFLFGFPIGVMRCLLPAWFCFVFFFLLPLPVLRCLALRLSCLVLPLVSSSSSPFSSSSPLSVFQCPALPSSCLVLFLPPSSSSLPLCLFRCLSQHLPNCRSQCEHCALHQRSPSAAYLFCSLLHLSTFFITSVIFFFVCRAGPWQKRPRATQS